MMQRVGRRPFWSVMIPTYQPSPGFLQETVDCVLQQDPGPEEMQVEVVDDGSPDGAPVDIVKQSAGERIRITSESRNLGLARIWNKCIERAKGEWVHILHQDDLVYPGFYKSLRTGLKRFPEAGAAFCRHVYGDESGNARQTSPLEKESPGIVPELLHRLVVENRIICAAMVVKKSSYEVVGGFDSRLSHALDWEMWIRLSSRFPIYYEPTVLACWRNHADATTSRQIETGENIRDIAKAIQIWKKYLPADVRRRYASLARKSYADVAVNFAEYFLGRGDARSSLKQLEAALICRPQTMLSRRVVKLAAKSGLRRSRLAIAAMIGATSTL